MSTNALVYDLPRGMPPLVGSREGRRLRVWLLAAGLAAMPLASGALVDGGYATAEILILLAIDATYLLAGLVASRVRPDSRFGTLLSLVAIAHLLSAFAESTPSLTYTVGLLIAPLYLGILAQALVTYPTGQIRERAEAVIVMSAYILCVAGQVAWMMALPARADDPCRCENLLLVQGNAAFADGIERATYLGATLLGLGAIAHIASKWRAASPTRRRVYAPVLAVATAVVLAIFVVFLTLLVFGNRAEPVGVVLLLAYASAPFAVLWAATRDQLRRSAAVGQLLRRLATTSSDSDVRDAIAEALRDPAVDLAYWVPDLRAHVNSRGSRVQLPGPGQLRAVTPVERDGRRVAAIVHDSSLLEDGALLRAVGAAAALVLDRQRLDAELRALVEHIHASRARIVSAGDAERGRLERRMRSGPEQRLRALTAWVTSARGTTRTDLVASRALLGAASEELTGAIDDLRAIARGIHPAMLSARGLAPALDALAVRSPIDVEIRSTVDDERLPSAIEQAVYLVAAETVEHADLDGHVTVSLARGRAGLVTDVHAEGDPPPEDMLQGLADRIGALGGTFEATRLSDHATRIRVVIPC